MDAPDPAPLTGSKIGVGPNAQSLLEKSKQKRHGLHGFHRFVKNSRFGSGFLEIVYERALALLINFGTRSLQFKRIIR